MPLTPKQPMNAPGGHGGGWNKGPAGRGPVGTKNWHQRWNASKDVAKRLMRLRCLSDGSGAGRSCVRLRAKNTLQGLGQGLGKMSTATLATVSQRVLTGEVVDAAAVAMAVCIPGKVQAVLFKAGEASLPTKAAHVLHPQVTSRGGFVVAGHGPQGGAATAALRPRLAVEGPSAAGLTREALRSLERNLLLSPTKPAPSANAWNTTAATSTLSPAESSFSDWELKELAPATAEVVPWPLPADAAAAAAPPGAFLGDAVPRPKQESRRLLAPAPTKVKALAPPPAVPVYNWARIELLEKLGEGSFGAVSRARMAGSATDVAVKVPLDAADTSLLKEARLMSSLRHPNLVRVFGVCRNPTALVSELVPQGSLAEVLEKRKGKVLPLNVVHKVVAGIAQGCRFLHAQTPPIVHRDLSANNVLLSNSWRPLLADFGLSKARLASCLSNGGETGTPNYMAPEVLSSGRITEKADVYSFGVLLWQVLSGKVPWENHSPYQIIYQVCFVGQRLEIPQGTHPGLASLMRQCWEGEPAERPGFDRICEVLEECCRPQRPPALQAA